MRTVFSRGHGTADLARALDPTAARVGESLEDEVVTHRAEVLVARRTTAGKGLLPVLVPRDLDLPSTRRVVAAVGGGPHSELAAAVASALAETLGVPARMLCAYDDPTGRDRAVATVAGIADLVPGIEGAAVHGDSVQDLIDEEGEGALLVLGAPGGSFLQRQFVGPGARLIASAPVGAVVVRAAPSRVFQFMEEPEWVGLHLPATEAARLHACDPIPVVDQGTVVGGVSQSALADAPPSAAVGEVMAETATLEATELLLEVAEGIDGDAPVVHNDRLVGLLPMASIR